MSDASSILICRGLSRSFADGTIGLDDVSLTLDHGDFGVLQGPSGCGKTTLLRQIAGLDRPACGLIQIDGRTVTDSSRHWYLDPCQRQIGFVAQTLGLWPHLTVKDHLILAMDAADARQSRIRQCMTMLPRWLPLYRQAKHERAVAADDLLDELGMARHASKLPGELSGGEKQRLALARALASQPRILLLDEPFANLDTKTKKDCMEVLRRLHQERDMTIFYVTHLPEELTSQPDVMFYMKQARLESSIRLENKSATARSSGKARMA